MKELSSLTDAIYFSNLTIENINCFRGANKLNFMSNDKPTQWTVILGNNNTGKTTILRALANLEAYHWSQQYDRWYPIVFLLSSRSFALSNQEEGYSVTTNLVIKENRDNSSDLFQEGKFVFFRDWMYSRDWASMGSKNGDFKPPKNLKVYGYGTSRKTGSVSIQENENLTNSASLFSNTEELINVEEWLLRLEFARNNDKSKTAGARLKKLREILTSEVFPDIQDFRFTTDNNLSNFVEFRTDYGWIKLNDLGYGYQASIAWMADFMKRMFDRYPDSENPLREPAIVLIDEIDLHLHPEWQRKIIGYLSNLFPNTQFIATTHSPLVVQSAENINLIILRKEGDHVTISQPEINTFKGWTVEEILTELMGMDDRVQSDSYLSLMYAFDDAIEKNDYLSAKTAYNELDKILHPESSQRKLLRIQMSSLERGSQNYEKTALAS